MSAIILDYAGVLTTANTSAGATSLTVNPFTTTARTLQIQCAAVGALTFWTPGIISGGYGVIRGVSQSGIAATNADQGCQEFIMPAAIPGSAGTIGSGSNSNPVSTVLAFNY
jgi:hypothetical protein